MISKDVENPEPAVVTTRESEIRWGAHNKEHEHSRDENEKRADALADAVKSSRDALSNSLTVAFDDHKRLHDQIRLDAVHKEDVSAVALKVALEDHHREHLVHDTAHQREHEATSVALIKATIAHEREHEATATALDKAEKSMDKRLESMNEFRAQLNSQASTFVTNTIFDSYVKEARDRVELALSSTNDKTDTVIRSVVNRHESDFNTIRELLDDERLKREKSEKESSDWQKRFEGSIGTFKYLVGLVGLPGLAAILYLLAQGAH